MNQKTIKNKVSISGKGLHTGITANVTLLPAKENFGIAFQRTDLENSPIVEADVCHVFDTSHSTAIKKNDTIVRTIEHLMAALAGAEIDNILITLDKEELPILDGSSKVWKELIKQAEICEQAATKKNIEITKEVVFEIPEKGVKLIAKPADDFKITVIVDYETKILSTQSADLSRISDFNEYFADARTFVFLHEILPLLENNLIKGGDLNNAIVFVADKPDKNVLNKLAILFDKKDIDVTENGVLNHCKLKYENDPARHKLLDLLGDLYLLGAQIKGEIIAIKPGHFSNTEFAKLIKKSII